MTTHQDILNLTANLPGVVKPGPERFAVSVLIKGKPKGFLWTWAEKVHPKKPKEINERVIAVRVPNEMVKQALIQEDQEKFFTEPHYNGYPAVLVRLDNISPQDLEPLLIEAWRTLATPAQLAEYRD